MKIGIIVYSQTGNTDTAAQKLKEKFDAAGHTTRIEKVTAIGEVKPGAKDVRLDNIPAVDTYDALVLASPVHAFSLPLAMAAYLQQLPSLEKRKIACFVTKMLPFNWTGGNGAIARIKNLCQEKGGVVCGSAIINCAKGRRDQNIAAAVERLGKLF
jgi:NAD(P)H dehydrogenase (quinone)